MLGGGYVPVPNPFRSSMAYQGQITNGFTLQFYLTIPEPGTLSLAGLIAAALLLLRRPVT